VYIWEAVVGPYHDYPKPDPEQWFGSLWKTGDIMKGFYALAKLMAPIPRGALALRGSTSTDMATAVFKSGWQVVVCIVNDLDVEKRITVTVNNVRVAGNPGTSIWTQSAAADNALLNSLQVSPSGQGFSVSVTMPVDSLITLSFTKV
jgi:hypothetical protein